MSTEQLGYQWDASGTGICFREDTNKVTNNNSEFLPHLVN